MKGLPFGRPFLLILCGKLIFKPVNHFTRCRYFCTMKALFSFLVVWMLYSSTLHAASIDKAFAALKSFNYFEAKRLFEKNQRKMPAAANYGLAVIYSRTDNPFHQMDSAFACVQRSVATYSGSKEKWKEKWKKHGCDYPAIDSLRALISSAFFQFELKAMNELGMHRFQQTHPWAKEVPQAIALRDSLAYASASTTKTAAAFAEFLRKYPESPLATPAQTEFYRLQYREQTTTDVLSSYINFEKQFPENLYVADAQDHIYRLSTKRNRVEDFAAFIQAFPNNRNVSAAWRKLYQLYMTDYSKTRLEQFRTTYPNYPFMDELNRDTELSEKVLLPYKQDGLFGWMDLEGTVVIPHQYSTVGFFKEGLAWAEKNGLYGYVNKANETIIEFTFESANEFESGRAVVMINDRYGIIDRSGTFLIKPEFKDLGTFTEGLIYAQKDSLYGFYDGFGFQRIQPQFDEAFSFNKGIAKVTYQGLDGFIDTYGSYVVRPQHEGVQFFSDSLLYFEDQDFVRFMRYDGKVIETLFADAVGTLQNDRAVFAYDGKVGYIEMKGKLVIPTTFDDFTNVESEGAFQGGFAKVKKAGKFGVIDRQGKQIIPCQYNAMGAPSTLTAIEKGGKWGFIDLANKMVLPATYEYAESFSDGLGIVQLLTLRGAINAKGQVIIPLNHTTIKKLDKNHYLVSIGAKYGIYNSKGECVVPLEYGQIRKVQDDFYVLNKGLEMHFFQVSTDKLIQPKLPDGN